MIFGRERRGKMEELLELLKSIKPGVDFEHCDDLIGSGAIESLDMVMIVTQIMQKYEIDIPPEEIIPENFRSAEAILKLIGKVESED